MQGFFSEVQALRWVILVHVVAAVAVYAACLLSSEKRFFSRWKVFAFGSLLSMDKVCLAVWCIAVSRLITVAVLACMPGQADYGIGLVIAVQTTVIVLAEGGWKTGLNELLNFAAVFVTLLLQGLFYSYFLEVESLAILPVVVVFLGSFAALVMLRQTIAVHEQLIRRSNHELTKVLVFRRRKHSDTGKHADAVQEETDGNQ